MPVILDDVEPDLREKKRPHVRNILYPKEKLSPIQLGFCHWWLTYTNIQSARKSTAVAHREAGIYPKIWMSSWSPDIVGDFKGILLKRLKCG
ncbi:hypothetical protein DPMN_042616 [Dreissena polymorpha]|uniref:Uncharacterized protein n=1 Tax=Dreissena polymorpha TaxID=45954 RepID=A0A9D4D1A8_DREPO|nr:hypothetical protein DPMN_042616 [Dreissena polymorpha]